MTRRDTELLDKIFLQPWFLPRDTAFAIKRLLPPEHRHKMKFYFDDYGCLKCGRKKSAYGANALCKLCMQQVKLKMFFAIKRRWTAASPDNMPRTFTRMVDAQRLLKDLLSRSARQPQRKRRVRVATGSRSGEPPQDTSGGYRRSRPMSPNSGYPRE